MSGIQRHDRNDHLYLVSRIGSCRVTERYYFFFGEIKKILRPYYGFNALTSFANELDNDESGVNDTDDVPTIFTTAFICRISSSCRNILLRNGSMPLIERNGWKACDERETRRSPSATCEIGLKMRERDNEFIDIRRRARILR